MADKITGKQVAEHGAALFGKRWIGRMADAFDVTRQTVNNWKSKGVARATFTNHLAAYILRQRSAITEAERLITAML